METNEVNYPKDEPTGTARPLFSDLLFGEATRYRHIKTGGIYEGILVATDEATGAQMKVYQSVETGKVWSRPLSEFAQKFTKI